MNDHEISGIGGVLAPRAATITALCIVVHRRTSAVFFELGHCPGSRTSGRRLAQKLNGNSDWTNLGFEFEMRPALALSPRASSARARAERPAWQIASHALTPASPRRVGSLPSALPGPASSAQ